MQSSLLALVTVLLTVFSFTALANESSVTHAAFEPDVAGWSVETKNGQRHAAVKLMAEFAVAIKEKKSEFTIAAGHYRFDQPGSNRFAIAGVANMRINAENVTFWFDPAAHVDAVSIRDSQNVVLHGLTIDYDPPAYIQGEILRLNPDEKSADLRLDPGFVKGQRDNAGSKVLIYDKRGKMREVRMDWTSSIATLPGEADVLRAVFRDGHIFHYMRNVEIGDRIVLPNRNGRHVVNSINSEKITLDGLSIYASPHMAIVEEGGAGGHVYRNCRVVLRPQTGRLLACNADVFHSVCVKYGPLIEGCEFSYAADDLINIQNFFSMVYEQIDPRTLIVVSQFMQDILEGCRLTFVDFDSLMPTGSADVVAVAEIKETPVAEKAANLDRDVKQSGRALRGFLGKKMVFKVTLNRPVNVAKYNLVDSEDRKASNTIIRNNYFHDGFVRTMLVRSGKALVENNRIEDMGWGGIWIGADRYWMEGPFSHDIIVRNNRLRNVGTQLLSRLPWTKAVGAVSVVTDTDGQMYPAMQNSNIQILDNQIMDSSGCGILMANTSGGRIEGNQIVRSVSRQPLPGEPAGETLKIGETTYGIIVEACRDVTIRNNTVTPSAYMTAPIRIGKWTEHIEQDAK